MATRSNGFSGMARLQNAPKVTEQMKDEQKAPQRESHKTVVSYRLDGLTKSRMDDLAKYYGASKTRVLEQLVDKEWALIFKK